MERRQVLRYGENPHQRAALYVTDEPRGIGDLAQRQGKELSFNNLLDIDAAMRAAGAWTAQVACAVIKHTTPCGLALGRTAAEAFRRARATDPMSAFGSVVAYNTVVDSAAANAMADLFVEVVVAPAFHADALTRFAEKKNLRVVELPAQQGGGGFDWKRIRGGFLLQDPFAVHAARRRVAGGHPCATPTAAEWRDLRFAWAAVSTVKSNAILLSRERTAHRDRCRTDEPGRRLVPGGPQGAPGGARDPWRGARLRRILPVPRRHRGSGPRGDLRRHPARRFGARCRK